MHKLDLLVKTLHREEYFGFLDSSEDYVNKIIDFIYTIPVLKKERQIVKDTAHFITNTNITIKPHGILLSILKKPCTLFKI